MSLAGVGYTNFQHDTPAQAYGGTAYFFILETFLPHLRKTGVTDEQINQMMVESPKRALTFVEPDPQAVGL